MKPVAADNVIRFIVGRIGPVAIAGEASLVISVEDIVGRYRMTEESTDPKTGEKKTRDIMNLDEVPPEFMEHVRADILAHIAENEGAPTQTDG